MNVIIRTIPVLELIFSSSKYFVLGTTIEIGLGMNTPDSI